MYESLVPIFICAILPISIVLIVAIRKMKTARLRADILMKAIESDRDVDIDKLAESLGTPKRSPKEELNRKLLRGCIFSLIGLVVCVCGIIAWCSGEQFSAESVEVPILLGSVSMAVGISFLVVYFVNRRQAHHSEDAPEKDTESL